jgi:hypothetical protein
VSEKLTKRELQSPDTFQTTMDRGLEWAHHHPREVSLIGVGLLAVIVISGLVATHASGGAHTLPGAAELGSALALVDRPVDAEATTTSEDKFPSEKAKQEAVEGALTKVRKDHEGTATAALAALPLADAKVHLGKLDEAIPLFQEYLDKAPADAKLRFLAYEGKGHAQMAKGDLTAAAATWDEMEKKATGYVDRAMFGRAELLEKQGKWDEARKAFQAVKELPGGSVLAGPAGEHVSDIERLHPSTAAAAAAPAATVDAMAAPAPAPGG